MSLFEDVYDALVERRKRVARMKLLILICTVFLCLIAGAAAAHWIPTVGIGCIDVPAQHAHEYERFCYLQLKKIGP